MSTIINRSAAGARLREERTRLGLNQEQFAALAGIQFVAQSNYETGKRSPDLDYLMAIAAAGADVLYIVTGARNAATLSADETELLRLFQAAPLGVKGAAIGALQGAARISQDSAPQSVRITASGKRAQAAGRDVLNTPSRPKGE